MRLAPRPTVYEINTAVWLERLGRGSGRPLVLGDVPGSTWDAIAALPVDAVWLMGVWQRSPHGLRIALTDPGLDAANRAALPDLRPEDVIGSPLLHVSVRERGDAIEQLEELVAITRGQEVKPQCELRFLTSG